MHYIISYDIAADRLRGRVAKLLERHGCRRMQRSVFAAPRFSGKQMTALKSGLHRLLGNSLEPEDSLFIVSIEGDAVGEMVAFGSNKTATFFSPPPLHVRL